jgi:hypothetical protein
VALGTATPFILGYRVVGDKIIISQAPKDNSAFIYQFHGSAFPRKFSTVVSVSRISAAAPLIQAAASGSTSTVVAEIMEGIRIECKDLDGKKVCKPIKVGDPVDEGFKLINPSRGVRVNE